MSTLIDKSLTNFGNNACNPVPIIIEGKEGEQVEVKLIFLDQADFEADRQLVIEDLIAVKEFGESEETAICCYADLLPQCTRNTYTGQTIQVLYHRFWNRCAVRVTCSYL